MGSLPTMPPMGSDSGGYPPPTSAPGIGGGAYPPPASAPGISGGMYPPPTPQVAYVVKPRAKWHALRTIATIFKVFAWIAGGLGVIAALATLAGGSQFGSGGAAAGLFLGVFELIGAGIGFLGLYGYAELILLLISIEENTRKI